LRTGYFILAMLVCLSCRAQRNSRDVQEDLASIRPTFPADSMVKVQHSHQTPANVPPVLTVNAKVDAVLDSIDRLNLLRRYTSGFTIQIYSGQNKEEANNAKKRLTDFLDMKADLQYIQPKFRVKVGAYFTALDAQKDLVLLKRFFPNAILVPETIPIK
jgi:hypothetical protein